MGDNVIKYPQGAIVEVEAHNVLQVTTGDVLLVIAEQTDPQWVYCRNLLGAAGYVHCNLLRYSSSGCDDYWDDTSDTSESLDESDEGSMMEDLDQSSLPDLHARNFARMMEILKALKHKAMGRQGNGEDGVNEKEIIEQGISAQEITRDELFDGQTRNGSEDNKNRDEGKGNERGFRRALQCTPNNAKKIAKSLYELSVRSKNMCTNFLREFTISKYGYEPLPSLTSTPATSLSGRYKTSTSGSYSPNPSSNKSYSHNPTRARNSMSNLFSADPQTQVPVYQSHRSKYIQNFDDVPNPPRAEEYNPHRHQLQDYDPNPYGLEEYNPNPHTSRNDKSSPAYANCPAGNTFLAAGCSDPTSAPDLPRDGALRPPGHQNWRHSGAVNLDTLHTETQLQQKSTEISGNSLSQLNHVQLQNEEWYHGTITRQDSEALLALSSVPSKSFLVRFSSNTNCYVISYKERSPISTPNIHHTNIKQQGRRYHVWGNLSPFVVQSGVKSI
ncbi:uncharacterized protein LOC108667998, partial [Hyalella azteca]|uniref:Uncharacterized protein LOC108667998 n=1 Tax=Hyalella azteca TaxID=294128 RepID=A0A8B7NAJ3_HYAAZ